MCIHDKTTQIALFSNKANRMIDDLLYYYDQTDICVFSEAFVADRRLKIYLDNC